MGVAPQEPTIQQQPEGAKQHKYDSPASATTLIPVFSTPFSGSTTSGTAFSTTLDSTCEGQGSSQGDWACLDDLAVQFWKF